jgi:hypothetical protein
MEQPTNRFPRAGVLIVVVPLLLPGGFFFAKGAVEVADRFSGRTVEDATVLTTALGERITNRGRRIPIHHVTGVTAAGQEFEIDDRRLYDIANGRTPLPARVEVSSLSHRVLAVRTEFGAVEQVGGATKTWLAALALVLGGGLMLVPFLVPWQTDARKAARAAGIPPPAPDWGALAIVSLAAVAVVGGVLAWDLLRMP